MKKKENVSNAYVVGTRNYKGKKIWSETPHDLRRIQNE